ncbi:uncharacterized protein EI90DRAFT_3130335 [Cantharellus anzutake]|uniref:uncharacterized protein n=1 Tax=Cantharellus anzutake TaxID=1750568 RepID=UPI001904FB89|nr:uncharacterized protein EI90DRAFT_3130335 [Cantharellus anzutake]KAF8323465.1 hypothetical protein EI90DRAFT_3130335 [Cantharellus anzutake]
MPCAGRSVWPDGPDLGSQVSCDFRISPEVFDVLWPLWEDEKLTSFSSLTHSRIVPWIGLARPEAVGPRGGSWGPGSRPLTITPSAPGGYWHLPKCNNKLKEFRSEMDALIIGLKSAVTADDHQQWLISTSEYVDAIIWIMHCQALWNYGDNHHGFRVAFKWLDTVHAQWIAIPMQPLYVLACERYIKSLPSESIAPPAPPTLSTLQNPLSPPPPLGFFSQPTPSTVPMPDPQPVDLEMPSVSYLYIPNPDPTPRHPSSSPLESYPISICSDIHLQTEHHSSHHPPLLTHSSCHLHPSVTLLPYLRPLRYSPLDLTPILLQSSPHSSHHSPPSSPLPPNLCQVSTFCHIPILLERADSDDSGMELET